MELTTEQQPEVDTDWTSSSDSFKHEVFDAVIESHDFTFLNFTLLNFYADWCPNCRMFGSSWGKFENRLKKRKDILEVADGVKPNFCVLKINRVDFEEQCGYSISIPSRPCDSTGRAPRRITTLFESWGKVRSYLTTLQHWAANIGRHDTPQAKFSYDLAPVEVAVALESKKWYDFDLCGGHVGGAFTVDIIAPRVFKTASKAFKDNEAEKCTGDSWFLTISPTGFTEMSSATVIPRGRTARALA